MAQTLQRPDADEDSFMRLTRTRTNKTQVGYIEGISCMLYSSLLWSIPPRQGLFPELTPDQKHLSNVETHFHCPDAFLNVDFKHRDDVSGLK